MANIGDIISSWTDQTDRLTRKQIAEAADVVVQTVGRWISGELEPSLDQYRRLITSKLPLEFLLDVGSWVHTHSRLFAAVRTEAALIEMDANNDGKVDNLDAGIWSNRAICASALAAQSLFFEGRFAEALTEARQARRTIDLMVRTLQTAQRTPPPVNGRSAI